MTSGRPGGDATAAPQGQSPQPAPLPEERPEERFRGLLEACPDAMVVVDGAGRIVLMNGEAEHLFGYPRDALLGQPVEVLVPERSQGRHGDLHAAYAQHPRVRPMGAGRDLKGRRADGSEFAADISLGPVETEAGTLFLAAVRDASVHRQAEHHFRNLLEASPDATVIVDPGGRISLVNRQTERLFGYPRAALIGKPLGILIPERFRGDHGKLQAEYFDRPRIRPMGTMPEPMALRADGSEFPVDIALSPLETEAGIMVYAAIRDNTARREAEARLQRLAGVVDSSGDAIIVKDLQGTIVEWNSGAEHLYGYTAEEVLGQPATILAPPDRKNEAPTLLARIARGEVVDDFETTRMRKDGKEVTVAITVSPVRDAHGTTVNASVVARDVTEETAAREALHAAHRELEVRADELERANRSLVLVNEMAEILGSVDSELEACEVAGNYGARLFPGVAGAVYLTNESGMLLEVAAAWGAEAVSDPVFQPDDCWSLRRGRATTWARVRTTPRCRHLRGTVDASQCIPLVAQGHPMGMVNLAHPATAPGGWLGVADEALAATFAESLAVAVANYRLRQMLQAQAVRDPLTGLFNRRRMHEFLEREVARAARTHSYLGLLLIDIDRFKSINDTYGHDVGDTFIREVARLLDHLTRAEDLAARLGGDEFLVALPGASAEDTLRRAEGMHRALRELKVRHLERTVPHLTATIGVACYPGDGDDPGALIRAADEAMYRGKRAGRDRVVSNPAGVVPAYGPGPRRP